MKTVNSISMRSDFKELARVYGEVFWSSPWNEGWVDESWGVYALNNKPVDRDVEEMYPLRETTENLRTLSQRDSFRWNITQVLDSWEIQWFMWGWFTNIDSVNR